MAQTTANSTTSSTTTRRPGRWWWTVGVLGVALITLWGCQDPAEALAEHFEAMALVAEANEEKCEVVGEELDAYWSEHRGEIAELAGKLGDSEKVQAQRIGVASQRLDVVVQACRTDENVNAFALDLADVVLKATGLPEATK